MQYLKSINQQFMKIKHICSVAMLAMLSSVAIAQQTRTISGTVVDNVGSPIVGAAVTVDGTSIGTITDSNGRYSLEAPEGAQISVQYVGYDPTSVAMGSQSTIDVTLFESLDDFEDMLVAMGYGIQKKSDIATSIATVGKKDLNVGMLGVGADILQGKVAGLSVTSDANPNRRNVHATLRGASTLRTGAAAEPYYVIDGVPGMSLELVAPDDIVSVDVLRDAAATAIYGSKGANGVIIISTKRGLEDKTEVCYNGFAEVGTVSKQYDMMSAADYRNWFAEKGKVVDANVDNGVDTNWQDEVQRTLFAHHHNLSIDGGHDATRYAASLSYTNGRGVMRGTDLEHFIGRAFVQTNALHDHLTLQAAVNASISKRNDIVANDEGESVFDAMAYCLPTLSVWDTDGKYSTNNATKSHNAKALQAERTYFERDKKYLVSGKATIDIIDGLKYDVSVAYQNEQNGYNYYFTRQYPLLTEAKGSASRAQVENTRLVFETYLTYAKKIQEKHNLDILLGYSWEENNDNDGIQVTGSNFFDDALGFYNIGMSNSTSRNDYGGYQLSTLRMISLYGRVNYNYDSRYLLQVTMRRDGSSAFGENNRWATFPSFAAAWRMSDEVFAENWNAIDDMKLRLGYGISGNSLGFDVFASRQLFGGTGWTTDSNGSSIQSLGPTSNANPDLKWERTKMMNAGLDVAMLGNRLKFVVDFYNKDTEDLIASYPVSTSKYLYGWMTANVGKINNRGFEIGVDATPVESGDFKWQTAVNLSHNRNEVKKISNDTYHADHMDAATINITGQTGYYTQRIMEGEPIGTFYTYEWAGYNADGISVFYEYDSETGERTGETTASPTDKDRTITGCAQPKLTLGWNNNLHYKGWSLGLFFTGVFGNDILNVTRARLSSVADMESGRYNMLTNADVRPEDSNSHIVSDRYVESGSYFRLSALSLAYDFGTTGWLSDLKVSIAGKNLFTATKYEGINPEIELSGSAPGLDYYHTHPQVRSVMLGLSMTF